MEEELIKIGRLCQSEDGCERDLGKNLLKTWSENNPFPLFEGFESGKAYQILFIYPGLTQASLMGSYLGGASQGIFFYLTTVPDPKKKENDIHLFLDFLPTAQNTRANIKLTRRLAKHIVSATLVDNPKYDEFAKYKKS